MANRSRPHPNAEDCGGAGFLCGPVMIADMLLLWLVSPQPATQHNMIPLKSELEVGLDRLVGICAGSFGLAYKNRTYKVGVMLCGREILASLKESKTTSSKEV